MEQLKISNFLLWAHTHSEQAEQFAEAEDRAIALREIEAGFEMFLSLRPEAAPELEPIREIVRMRLAAPAGAAWVLRAQFRYAVAPAHA